MASERDIGPQLSSRLGYLLKRAHLGLERLHEELLAPHGISARQLAVLLLLDSRPPESQQQVAARLGVDRTTMVGLLDDLEALGLVARRPDAADRRRNVVALTSAGRKTLAVATVASDEAERRLLAGLDDHDAAQFRAFLARLNVPD